MVDMAINSADFAETTVKKVGEALSDLKETTLKFQLKSREDTGHTMAKGTLRECRAVQQEALYTSKAASSSQCQQTTSALSETQLELLIPQAGAEASNTAINAANKVQKMYSEMQDKLETTDVCNLPIEPFGNTLSIKGANSMAEMAIFGDTMSTIAFKISKEIFLQMRECAMECRNSQCGREAIDCKHQSTAPGIL